MNQILWDDRPTCESCDFFEIDEKPTDFNIHGYRSRVHMGACTKPAKYSGRTPRDNKACVGHTHKGRRTYHD